MDKPAKSQKKLLTKNEIKKKVVTEDQKKKVLDTIMRSPRQRTFGQKASDWVTKWFGSWTFLTLFFLFMAVLITINFYIITVRWDPYPFILFNLVLSCLAAVQAPIILMSQNRQTERDRLRAEQNYRVDKKAELEIEDIQRDLELIKQLIRDIKNSKKGKN